MSWLDVDEPELTPYHDWPPASPYFVSGGVSIRHSPSNYTATWAAPGYPPVPQRELSETEQVLERERQIRKDLGL